MTSTPFCGLVIAASLALPTAAFAREYPIGGPVHAHDMEIAANYLVGVEMAPMPPGMAMGPQAIHLETDVHATADNVWGFADGSWIPYLKITYTLTKEGSTWHAGGQMLAMTAKDGAHYANNVQMDGPGRYTVKLHYEVAGDERLPAPYRRGNRRAEMVGCVRRVVHVSVSAEVRPEAPPLDSAGA